MWNSQRISISGYEIGEFSVSIRIQEASGVDWWLSGVYGPCNPRDRVRFWEELAGLYGLCGQNWCIGGDFNVVRFVSEKSNGGRETKSMRSFNDFINDTNRRDPCLLNADFTWSKLREEVVCRRLDRFLFTGEWEEIFPFVKQTARARVIYDHCPIELDTTKPKWGPCPFRFENMWVEHAEFKKNFEVWWGEDHLHGWEGYKFSRRLRLLRTKCKDWSKQVFGDIMAAKKELEARIAELDRLDGRQGLDEIRRKEREDLCRMVVDTVNKEEARWRQRGKVLWAREGDGNTKLFHQTASGRRKRNYIERLQVEGSRVIENEGEIEVEILNFFKRLFTSNDQAGWRVEGLNWQTISGAEAAWIERSFDEEEVKRAVFDCRRDKSPGPDGFSLFLFQSA